MTTSVRFLTLALLTTSTLVLTECSKSSEAAPSESERERFLTTPGWNTTAYVEVLTTASGVVTTTDILPTFDACFMDDLNHFNADKSFTVDDGPIKCGISFPSSNWGFASNETELVFDPGQPGEAHYQILTLTATTLTFAETSVSPDGTRRTLIKTCSAR